MESERGGPDPGKAGGEARGAPHPPTGPPEAWSPVAGQVPVILPWGVGGAAAPANQPINQSIDRSIDQRPTGGWAGTQSPSWSSKPGIDRSAPT
eukprot:scaffold32_cov368-Prasinococcus_capsulatus_cf.AAC.10